MHVFIYVEYRKNRVGGKNKQNNFLCCVFVNKKRLASECTAPWL